MKYTKQLNIFANLRAYLMSFTSHLAIAGPSSIQLQANTLVQWTQLTHHLSRQALVCWQRFENRSSSPLKIIAAERCYQLAITLHSMATRISTEDAQEAATVIAQCTSNIITVKPCFPSDELRLIVKAGIAWTISRTNCEPGVGSFRG